MNLDWLLPAWRSVLAQHRHHALLVHGPAGIGKSAFAHALARAWLCEAPQAGGAACERCLACGWFAQGNHPDFRLLTPGAAQEAAGPPEGERGGEREGEQDGERPQGRAGARAAKVARDIRIEQVRALERFVEVSAHRGGCKVVLIDPADALNAAAANALLKTLEEPGGATRFVLVTDRPDALPATVRSRCASLALPMPRAEAAIAWLVAQTGADASLAHTWLSAAGGAPLRARRFADPTESATHRLVMETLAGLPETGIVQAADALSGIEASAWLGSLQCWVADLQRVRAGAGPRFFPERIERLDALAHTSSPAALDRLALQLGTLARAVDHPLNPRLLIEDALLRVRAALAG